MKNLNVNAGRDITNLQAAEGDIKGDQIQTPPPTQKTSPEAAQKLQMVDLSSVSTGKLVGELFSRFYGFFASRIKALITPKTLMLIILVSLSLFISAVQSQALTEEYFSKRFLQLDFVPIQEHNTNILFLHRQENTPVIIVSPSSQYEKAFISFEIGLKINLHAQIYELFCVRELPEFFPSSLKEFNDHVMALPGQQLYLNIRDSIYAFRYSVAQDTLQITVLLEE